MFALKQKCGGCVLSEPRGWTRPYVSQQAACCGPSSEFKHLRASISTIRLPTQERELTAVGNMQQAYITLHQGSQARGMSISTTLLSLGIISIVLSISLSTIWPVVKNTIGNHCTPFRSRLTDSGRVRPNIKRLIILFIQCMCVFMILQVNS